MNDQKITLPPPTFHNDNDFLKKPEMSSDSNKINSSDITSSGLNLTHLDAQDVDLIEKHWVEHIRKMFNRFRGDPYQQLANYNMIKQEYLLKRFNKSIS